MLCYVMLCYVMLCYVMLCYVMLCYVATRFHFPSRVTNCCTCAMHALRDDVLAYPEPPHWSTDYAAPPTPAHDSNGIDEHLNISNPNPSLNPSPNPNPP